MKSRRSRGLAALTGPLLLTGLFTAPATANSTQFNSVCRGDAHNWRNVSVSGAYTGSFTCFAVGVNAGGDGETVNGYASATDFDAGSNYGNSVHGMVANNGTAAGFVLPY